MACQQGQWPMAEQHACRQGSSLSVHSCAWYDVSADDWFTYFFHIGDPSVYSQDDGNKPMFHGTTLIAAQRMVTGEGFIVGQGTHVKGKRSCSGAWVVESFGEAFERADPNRAKKDGKFDLSCMPVVVQMRCDRLTRMPGGCRAQCCEAEPGRRHSGVVIEAVHVCDRLLVNWRRLEKDKEVQQRLQHDETARMCACQHCGQVTWAGDPQWSDWRKSGNGLYYAPQCYKNLSALRRCI